MPRARNTYSQSCLLAGMVLLSAFIPQLSQARNQWDINHGASNPPIDPRFLPGGQFSGYVPVPQVQGTKIDFWKTQLANRIPAGTVLTAILEHDLHSAKNQSGDIFTLTLEDGFVSNGQALIPPKSKIICSVINATPAARLKAGAPGRLEVSLQSLVFPDGSHIPIYGFIDGNPGAVHKQKPRVKNLGASFSDYGQQVSAMAFSFVSGIGAMQNVHNRGADFQLDKGEAIPVRLSRDLDIPPTQQLSAQPPGGFGGSDSSGIPYPPGANGSQQAVPGLVDPQGPVYVPPRGPAQQSQQPNPAPSDFQQGNMAPPGFQPGNMAPSGFQQGNMAPPGFQPGNMAPSGFQPGNMAPSGFQQGTMAPPGFQPGNMAPSGFQPGNMAPSGFQPGNAQGDFQRQQDPNPGFNQPVNPPTLNDMPDPF